MSSYVFAGILITSGLLIAFLTSVLIDFIYAKRDKKDKEKRG